VHWNRKAGALRHAIFTVR